MNKLVSLMIIASLFAIALSSCDVMVNPEKISTSTELTLLLNKTTLSSAFITDLYPTTNFKHDDDFSAMAFKDSIQRVFISRTIFKIDLSKIPRNATITNAQLLLNYNPAPFHYRGAGHHNDSGSNGCFMQRVTQAWNVDDVTWGNQPQVTTLNQILLNASSSPYQNYVVDMTSAIDDMVKNPTTDFGFLLRLQSESPVRGLAFTSGSCRNDNIRPVLRVSYDTLR